MDEQAVCLDADGEIAYALVFASNRAKETGKCQYLFTRDPLIYCTSGYPSVPRKQIIAEVYPGGRKVLYRKVNMEKTPGDN